MEDRGHYLFGYEKRISPLRSAISTAASAQWEALMHCASAGIRKYDLNGYVVDAERDHPYYGVCQFKKQFAGQVIKYEIPEFLIQ